MVHSGNPVRILCLAVGANMISLFFLPKICAALGARSFVGAKHLQTRFIRLSFFSSSSLNSTRYLIGVSFTLAFYCSNKRGNQEFLSHAHTSSQICV